TCAVRSEGPNTRKHPLKSTGNNGGQCVYWSSTPIGGLLFTGIPCSFQTPSVANVLAVVTTSAPTAAPNPTYCASACRKSRTTVISKATANSVNATSLTARIASTESLVF